jgi:hypothetical protein
VTLLILKWGFEVARVVLASFKPELGSCEPAHGVKSGFFGWGIGAFGDE